VSGGGGLPDRYVETAFKVQVKRRPSNLLCAPLYGATGKDVGVLRSLLRGRDCPTTLTRVGGELMLCCVPDDECAEILEKYVGTEIRPRALSEDALRGVVHDAIRLELLKKSRSFRIVSQRIIDIQSRDVIIRELFVKYNAYKTRVLRYKGLLYFAVDKAYKLEPAPEVNLRNIAERLPEILENVDQVKVVEGSRRAFMLTHSKCGGSQKELAKRLLEFMGVRADSINWEEAVLYEVQPHPLSYTFRFMLKQNNLLTGEGVTCLPDVVLYPVASLDTVKSVAKALNKEIDLGLTLSPQERLEEARGLASRVAGEIAFGDLELLLDENVLEIPAGSEDLVATKASLYVHRLGAEEPEIAEVFNPRDTYEAIRAPKTHGEKIRVALVRRKDVEAERLGDQAEREITAFKNSLESRLRRETELEVEVENEAFEGGLEDRDSVENFADQLKSSNYDAVVAPVISAREYALFEFYAAKLGLLPQSIDLSKPTELRWRALPIARHLEYKLGFRLALVADYPPILSGRKIGALDATPIKFRGYAKMGVTPVISDPSCTDIEYLDPVIGENEEEVIRGGLSVLADKHSKMLVYVNRAWLRREVLEEAGERFDDPVVVAVSKQGIPRLVKVAGGSAKLPERGVFVWHGVEEVGSFREYSFVGVTNIVEEKDLTPVTGVYRVYVPKDVELDAGTRAALFSYVQSSTMVFVESPMHLPSLPQPLHEAHRLSKKLFKVARWVPIAELRRDILKNL
jgi:hypothetical protein